MKKLLFDFKEALLPYAVKGFIAKKVHGLQLKWWMDLI